MSGVIAIVGRPNVGKSALFNRLVGRRIAIVHDEPGVTRDRLAAEAEWRGVPFTLVDTGGLGLLRGEKAGDPIVQAAVEQVQIAIDSAHAILLVVNVREGVVPLDREVAARLRASGKPVLVAVNKADDAKSEAGVTAFAELGFEQLHPVSALHGRGMEPLMKAALDLLPRQVGELANSESAANAPSPRPPLKLAIIGRPNVGKSSLINALTRSERVIVSPVPGTTRDSIDVPFEVDTDGRRERYVLIDTAGLRKRRRIADSVEFFSVQRAEASIARCDLAILVLEAESAITEQDKKIGDLIIEYRRPCIVVVNKWDLIADQIPPAGAQSARRQRRSQGHAEASASRLSEFGAWVQEKLFFLDYAPVIFASAKTGFHLDRLLEAVRYVAAQREQKVPTSLLNRTLREAVEMRPPPSSAGHRLKLFYATQVDHRPPKFLLFVNRTDLFTDQYRKYLAVQLRRAFGFEGCPVVLIAKPRPRHESQQESERHPPRRRGGRRPGEGRGPARNRFARQRK